MLVSVSMTVEEDGRIKVVWLNPRVYYLLLWTLGCHIWRSRWDDGGSIGEEHKSKKRIDFGGIRCEGIERSCSNLNVYDSDTSGLELEVNETHPTMATTILTAVQRWWIFEIHFECFCGEWRKQKYFDWFMNALFTRLPIILVIIKFVVLYEDKAARRPDERSESFIEMGWGFGYLLLDRRLSTWKRW